MTELLTKIEEYEKALALQNHRLALYANAINQIDDYFEYRMESKKDQDEVHRILDDLTGLLS